MMTALDHPLVLDYLDRLRRAALRLPAEEGRELEAQIREHLAEALGEAPTEVEVRQALDRLGDPDELVAAAGPAEGATGSATQAAPLMAGERATWHEPAALICLVASAVLSWLVPVAVVLWLAGMALLVTSRRWSVTEKVWGGVVLGSSWVLAVVTASVAWLTTATVEQCVTDSAGVTSCTTDGANEASGVLPLILLVAWAVLYVVTLVHLARVARRRA